MEISKEALAGWLGVAGVVAGYGVRFVQGAFSGAKKREQQEQAKASAIASEVERYKDELKETMEGLLELKSTEVTALRDELQATRHELESTRAELKRTREESTRLQDQLNQARSELVEMRKGQAACSVLNTDQCPAFRPKVQT